MPSSAKIRSGFQKHETYPLNQFPAEVIHSIGARLVHRIAIGQSDISGDDFCSIFAEVIGGIALGKPLGVADVVWNGCAWSIKTVKYKSPHEFTVGAGTAKRRRTLRLITGRNNPLYSFNISDPLSNVQKTGDAVIKIYNTRISEARSEHDDLRLLVLNRNWDRQQFTLFERGIHEIPVNDCVWRKNRNNNLEGHLNDKHVFTWQPHGSQFTVIEDIPTSAIRFQINRKPPTISLEDVLEKTGFSEEWIEIVQS